MCEWSVPDWVGATAPSPPPDHLYSPPNSLVRCELPSDPLWAKMSSTGASSKKRKKPDTKPQSQLAKSLNEKRRRELENIFIEELAELISAASFADMSSLAVKPDKCAILQETVNQIKHIKEQEAAATRTIDAVQQGEVSSSKPTILTNDFFGPLLLEALEGFLFIVNQDGKVEYVTDNIATFIKFTKDEILGKPVYNILHHGDHGRFNSALLPPVWSSLEGSSSSVVASGGGSSSNSTNPPRNRTFNCRFLIKPPEDSNQTVEEKQQRVSMYENMQVVLINSTQIAQLTSGGDKDEEGNDIGPCLMCVARRIMPNEKHHAGTSMEQFSMKMDPQGKIIGIDTTGLSQGLFQFINKKDLIGKNLDNVVHAGDFSKVSNHLKDVQSHSQGTSSIYRIRVTSSNSGDKYIHVQTKSKLFKSISEPDFIMCTHSIVTAGGEEQSFSMGEANSPASVSGQSTSSSMGNQMMLSGSINGAPIRSETTPSSVSSSELANTINSLSNTSNFQTVSPNQGLVSNELSHDITFADLFPSTTWPDMGERIGTGMTERGGWERSESRASLTSASSPLAPAPATPSYSTSSIPFSPSYMDDKESNEAQGSSNPCRLRNLLTEGIGAIKRESTDSESGAGGGGNSAQEHPGEKNKYSLLTKILNEKEEDQQGQGHHPDQSPHNKPKNNMLLQLLNKNDDEDMEQKGGASDDILLNNLGLGSLTTSQAETIRRGTKRPSSEDNQGIGSGGNTPQGGDDGPNLPKDQPTPF
uniref:Nuclear receptor coactivator 2 n=2 Tax=Lygus hesperus TaxID=30085 RepID=A0A0K8SAR1_LYGHE